MAYGLRGKEVEVVIGQTYSMDYFFEVYQIEAIGENWRFANMQVGYWLDPDGTLAGDTPVKVTSSLPSEITGDGTTHYNGNVVFAGTTTWPNTSTMSSINFTFLEGYSGGSLFQQGHSYPLTIINEANYSYDGTFGDPPEITYAASYPGYTPVSLPSITVDDEPTLSISPLSGSRLEVIEGTKSGFVVTLSKAADHPITVNINLEHGGLREEVSVETFIIPKGVTKFNYDRIESLSDNELENTFVAELNLTATGKDGKAVKFKGGLTGGETEEASLDLYIRDSVIAGYDGQNDVIKGIKTAKQVISYRDKLFKALEESRLLKDPDGYLKALGEASSVAGKVLDAGIAYTKANEALSAFQAIHADYNADRISLEEAKSRERKVYIQQSVDILDALAGAVFESAGRVAGAGAAGFAAGVLVGLGIATSPVTIPVATVVGSVAGIYLGKKLWDEFKQDFRDSTAIIIESHFPEQPEPVRINNQSHLDLDGGRWIYTSKASSVTVASGTTGIDQVFFDGSGTLKLPDSIENAILLDPGSVGSSLALMKAAAGASVVGNKLRNDLTGNSLANSLAGEGGADRLMGGGGKDQLDGGVGKDTADYSDKSASVKVALEGAREAAVRVGGQAEDVLVNIENLIGGSAGDSLAGDDSSNKLAGGDSGDKLVGRGGKDGLDGGWGRDKLVGGAGRDLLSGGFDYEKDVFVFTELQDSTAGKKHDVIQDFLSGTDVIDLRGVDANTSSKGDDDFHIAKGAKENSVWWKARGDDLLLQADVTGDKKADFEILLQDAASVGRGDLLL